MSEASEAVASSAEQALQIETLQKQVRLTVWIDLSHSDVIVGIVSP